MQEMAMECASVFPTHLLILEPGFVAMKATATMTVLDVMHETAMVNMVPKAICRKRHVNFAGRPMNNKAERKENRRAMRRV